MRYELEGYVTDIDGEIYSLGEPMTCAFRATCGESLVTVGDVPASRAPRIGDRVKVTVEVGEDA